MLINLNNNRGGCCFITPNANKKPKFSNGINTPINKL